MLKHILAFLALILVSLAPVYADEGYIPYFPDFLEPDGIGFRGPSSIAGEICWSSKGGCDTHQNHQPGMPFSTGSSSVRSSPITLEYRKNYLFKKLIYVQALADFGSVVSNAVLTKDTEDPTNSSHYTYQVLLEDPIMKNFLTAEEKSILSSLDSSRILDIKTESNFILFGASIGLDLWFIEISNGIFLMHHQTKASLRSCKPVNWGGSSGIGFDWSQCRFNPDDIIKVSDQSFSGFAFGRRDQINLVFLQTDNWRISMENSFININTNIQYKGLNYYSNLSTSSGLVCSGDVTVYDENWKNGKVMDDECINVRGEDMSSSADYTYGLQITYYFR